MLREIFWLHDNSGIKLPNHKKMIIVGPSGSGKSTLADYLCKTYPDIFEIVVNCTTRPKRATDDKYFRFITETEFLSYVKNGEFYFCRIGNFPFYGYKKIDYNEITANNKIPIFMFRFIGFEQLEYVLSNYYPCFILSDVNNSIAHSHDTINKNLKAEALYISLEIAKKIEEFKNKEIPFSVLTNNYNSSFFIDIENCNMLKAMMTND